MSPTTGPRLLAWALVGGLTLGTFACGSAARPAAEQAADATVTAGVRDELRNDVELRAFAIDVATLRGVVTLTGRVDREDHRVRAAELAARVDGVDEVRNLIRIDRRAP